MEKNMLNEALSELWGPLGQLIKNLLGNDGDLWLTELKKFLRKEPTWKEKSVADLRKREEKIVRAFALVLGISLLTAFASFMFYVGSESNLALLIGQSSTAIMALIILISCVIGLAGIDGPGFVPLSKNWAHNIGAEFPTYAIFYLVLFPLMSCLFIVCLSGIFDFYIYDFSKSINDPETWKLVAWTTATYIPVLIVGLIWRFIRLNKRSHFKKLNEMRLSLEFKDLLNR